MDNNALQHHGILGMKWGRRRYQNKDGTLTEAGKKRYGDSDNSESYEDAKQKAIKSGSAKEVLRYKGDLTKQEMDSAIARIRWEQDMQNIASKEVSSGKAMADKVFKSMDAVTGYASSAAKAWNTFANVYNAFGKSDVSLPKIDTNITSGNRSERKQEKKESENGGKKAKPLKDIWNKKDKLSDKDLSDALRRANTEKAIKKILDDEADNAKKEAQKQVDDYNNKQAIKRDEEARRQSGSYSMKGSQVIDNTVNLNTKVSDVRDNDVSYGQSLLETYEDRPIAGLLPPPRKRGK